MFLLLLVGGLIICWQIKDTGNSVINNHSPIRIGVSQTPLSAPFIIAEHLKLFKKRNINISYVPCKGGVKCADLLNQGAVEYATASESVAMFNSFTDDDLALVVSFVESMNDLKLLALKSSDLSSVHALAGKKVGIIQASASEFYFDTLLIVNNLKDMPVTKVYLSPEEMVNQLISYQLDAVSIWEPYGYRTHLQSGDSVVNLGLPGVYQLSFNLLSRKSYLHGNNVQAADIIRGLGNAIEWIHTHPEQAKEIVSQKLDIPLNEIDWSWDDYVFRLSIGSSLLTSLQLQSRWAMERGLVQGTAPDYRSVIYSQPFEVAEGGGNQ